MAQKVTNKLAALPQDISIDRYEKHHNTIELFISYPAEERICPYCDSHDCVIHSSGHMETIRHTGLGDKIIGTKKYNKVVLYIDEQIIKSRF